MSARENVDAAARATVRGLAEIFDTSSRWSKQARLACEQLQALQIESKKEAIRKWTAEMRGKPYLYALHKDQITIRAYDDVFASIGGIPQHIGALYLHFPYCTKHCTHCHYYKTTYGGAPEWARFPNFLTREIELLRKRSGSGTIQADTIHIGGGTPSLIDRDSWATMMQELCESVALQQAREIAVEVDPADLTLEHLLFWHRSGVNRISLGVQSFDDDILRGLHRQHDRKLAISAIGLIQKSDIENLNVDLMYGMPGRGLATWQADLDTIAELRPQSVTCYATRPDPQNQLSVAKSFPSEAERLVAHQMAISQLLSLDYIQYSPNQFIIDYSGACLAKNNRNRCLDVLGVGPHAHSILRGWFYENAVGVEKYIETIREGRLCEIRGEQIESGEARRRYMQFGIKLSGLKKPLLDNGISRAKYGELFGSDCLSDFEHPMAVLRELQLIDKSREDAVSLTHSGVLLAEDVVKMFGVRTH
jgi:oxygen-independent coproporphyrinogen-3 oxidase